MMRKAPEDTVARGIAFAMLCVIVILALYGAYNLVRLVF